MKTIKHLGRHEAEILDEIGKRIDYAKGRENVWKMRQSHGLDEIKPTPKDTAEIPTGFENGLNDQTEPLPPDSERGRHSKL